MTIFKTSNGTSKVNIMKLSFRWFPFQGGPGGRGFPGADGPAGPKVS